MISEHITACVIKVRVFSINNPDLTEAPLSHYSASAWSGTTGPPPQPALCNILSRHHAFPLNSTPPTGSPERRPCATTSVSALALTIPSAFHEKPPPRAHAKLPLHTAAPLSQHFTSCKFFQSVIFSEL